ncbi:MAG: peroxiredoxin [Gammaproteobacteria bacterium]|nr:peroxiredoxin [Gammaproteobacteria bacterium]MBL6999729.1 peroxiredoxin [Gammaproteobacteria bacterium]
MLTTNQSAPDFDAIDEVGHPLRLADFLGKKNVVLYFYPKDDTPGCTIQANQFSALIEEFNQLDTVVIGVSKDSCASHQAFIDKFSLKVRLMSDDSGKVCEDYGVWQEKEKNGVKKMGIVRSTFIINQQGLLTSVEYDVAAEGHAQRVLDFIRHSGPR